MLGSIPILTRREKRVCRLQIFRPLISNGFTSTFHFGCENEIYFLLLPKKKRTKNYSPYFKTKMLRNSSFSVWIQTAPTLPIWNYFPKEKCKVIFLWLMKDHDTEAQIWYITIARKFIGCSLACFLSVFSFMFCYTFL